MSPVARAFLSFLVIAVSAAATVVAVRLRPPQPPPPSQVASVFAFSPAVVYAIEARTWQGSIRAVRNDGRWEVEYLTLHESVAPSGPAPKLDPAGVNGEVTALVRAVVALPEVNRFPLEGALSDFGLDEPQATIVLTLDIDRIVTLELGARTTTGAGLYAHIVSSDEVLQIGGLILNEIGGAFYQLRGLARSR